MANSVIDLCKHSIFVISEDQKNLKQKEDSMVGPLQQLQDALSSLCARCLPLRSFQISPMAPLPLSFSLPDPCSDSKCRTRCRRRSKQSQVLATDHLISGDTNFSSSDDDVESIENGHSCGTCRFNDNFSLGDGESSYSSQSCNLPTLSKQSRSELEANYARLFDEFSESRKHTIEAPLAKPWIEIVELQASKTRAIVPFVKIAFPEFVPADARADLFPLNENTCFAKAASINQMVNNRDGPNFKCRVVYDLDQLIMNSRNSLPYRLSNNDLNRIGTLDRGTGCLAFESRFEGGNLRRATEVATRHYELLLSPDINQKRPHFQWFYFEVSNMEAGVPYMFEIINCLKSTSMFSSGMQPVLFSVTDYTRKHLGWTRAGSSVCYYRNLYVSHVPKIANTSCVKKKTSAKKGKASIPRTYYTIKFEMIFQNSGDVCYIAYHFPYTYTLLQASISTMIKSAKAFSKSIYAASDCLCYSLAGHPVPIVTVTSAEGNIEVEKRDVIVLFSRVHPGESNSSWIMHGVLEFLLSVVPEATELRERFLFKLIPMLNPDGVINGSHRCSLAGVDLNRVWDQPSPVLHPSIFHSKGVIQYLVDALDKRPLAVVDFHGHSRCFNVFMYGNNPEESWKFSDHSFAHNNEFLLLPEILAQKSSLFSLSECGFGITQGKEPSARVVLWRQFQLSRVYTMEASYCGFNKGLCAGNQVNISHLKQLGRDLCESFLLLKERLNLSMPTTSSSSL